MISPGHFVQDWMGRAGIALGACGPPERAITDDGLERIMRHCGDRSPWWRIALFSGAVVKSPEPATDSWGPVSAVVLAWAIRRADPTVAGQLEYLSQRSWAEKQPI